MFCEQTFSDFSILIRSTLKALKAVDGSTTIVLRTINKPTLKPMLMTKTGQKLYKMV